MAGDLSLRELAALSDLSPTYPSLIESGARPNVGSEKLGRIAKVLGTTIDFLMTGTGPAPTEKRVRAAVRVAREEFAKRPETPKAKSETRELADVVTDEVTPAEAPAPKRLSSRPPPAPLPPAAAPAVTEDEFHARSRDRFALADVAGLADAAAADEDTTPGELPSSTPGNLPPIATVKPSERDRAPTDPDDRGDVLEPTPKPLTALDVPVPERVTILDDERTPTPTPDT